MVYCLLQPTFVEKNVNDENKTSDSFESVLNNGMRSSGKDFNLSCQTGFDIRITSEKWQLPDLSRNPSTLVMKVTAFW
jgi:hypothetical protein